MMSLIKQYKNILIFAGIFAVLIIVYTLFFKSSPPTGTLTTQTADLTTTLSDGQDLVGLLFKLQSVKLDQSIFTNPTFRSLKDFSQPIPTQAVGRENPFAPISGVSSTP